MAGQLELVRQRHQLVEAVALADEREGDVLAPQLVDDDGGGPHHDVHPVLRPHDPDIGGQVLAAAPLGLIRLAALELARVGPGADDCNVRGVLAASVYGDLTVGVVGGDHVVGAAVRPALKEAQPPVRQ